MTNCSFVSCFKTKTFNLDKSAELISKDGFSVVVIFFISFSAVTSGIKEIKKIMQEAEANTAYGQKTIVSVET